MIPQDVHSALNLAAILVVTLATMWAGYQIAFRHKSVSAVVPLLAGSLAFAAALQLARPFIH
ncbi:MAG: hypothetical protein EON92_05775 [Burkholderiales bacterium]|nr:MAG: hypothetical protein EON92_05775 [Burkholderiales bacterium]